MSRCPRVPERGFPHRKVKRSTFPDTIGQASLTSCQGVTNAWSTKAAVPAAKAYVAQALREIELLLVPVWLQIYGSSC
jgi:hypothetical protein